jgi:hypothetical protein
VVKGGGGRERRGSAILDLLEYAPMPDESNAIPVTRLARWILLGFVIAGGAVLYFRDGARLPPFGSVAPAATTDSTR